MEDCLLLTVVAGPHPGVDARLPLVCESEGVGDVAVRVEGGLADKTVSCAVSGREVRGEKNNRRRLRSDLVQWMCSPSSSLANRREEQTNNSDPVRACSFPTNPFCQRTWDSSTETVLVKRPPEKMSIILSMVFAVKQQPD